MTRVTVLSLLCAAAALSGCSVTNGFCAAAADCSKFEVQFPLGLDEVGDDDDSQDVCVAQEQGFLDELRANQETACHELADSWEKFMACAADAYGQDTGDACRVMSRGSDNPCHGELNNFFEDAQNIGDKCSQDQT
jgi:hypothetical protein